MLNYVSGTLAVLQLNLSIQVLEAQTRDHWLGYLRVVHGRGVRLWQ